MGIWQIPWREGPGHSWQARLDAGSSGGLEMVLTKNGHRLWAGLYFPDVDTNIRIL